MYTISAFVYVGVEYKMLVLIPVQYCGVIAICDLYEYRIQCSFLQYRYLSSFLSFKKKWI